MSGSFFGDLGIREPDFNLSVGSGSHAQQTAQIMVKFEEVCNKEKPDSVVVVGDVNSTIAAGLVAKKLQLELSHVEAGLRSGDRGMPEEINRIATDAITDLYFTTEETGTKNLLTEGVPQEKVHFVGHVMIDNLLYQIDKISSTEHGLLTYPLKKRLPDSYICLTLHRPSNVDTREKLEPLMKVIQSLAQKVPIIFSCHPRTQKQLTQFGLISMVQEIPSVETTIEPGLYRIDPLGFNDFVYLWKDATVVLTDSGGMQEETTALGVPCITLRENTERPITAEIGTNEVIGTDPEKVAYYGNCALEGKWKKSQVPPLWDGHASDRIAKILAG